MFSVFVSPCVADKTLKCAFASTRVTILLWGRSTTWKHLSKPIIRPAWPVFRQLRHIETTPFKKFMTNLRKWKKLTHGPRFSHVHSETQKLLRQNTNVSSFAKRALPSFPRDRWRNCPLNSSNSIGSECSLEFVIFSQPMVRVTIIHEWVTTFIVVHDRCTTNGYALPVPHVMDHKMDLQWKPQSNLCKKFSRLYYMRYIIVIEISTALHGVCICICK